MAFISEINFLGGDAANEWVEVALAPDDDPGNGLLKGERVSWKN